jgi:asparagine N-glycosylation enzyme membrane subunit Stt3
VFVVLGLALLLKPTEAGTPVPWPKAQDGGRVLGAVASMVIFTSLVPVLGFPVAAALFLAAMIWWWADYSPWLAVLLGVVLALTMMLVFQVLLNAPLPEGLWQ